jgi:ATP-dependent helicase/nuclease subunit B
MPVRFILGPAGSGKTHHCLGELRDCERAGRVGIYLVPEQFTYSADRELLSDPSMPGLRRVQVLSFSRLGYRLREEAGAPVGLAVSAAVRSMLLRAVLARLDPQLLGAMTGLRGRQGLLDELGPARTIPTGRPRRGSDRWARSSKRTTGRCTSSAASIRRSRSRGSKC